MTTPAAVQKLYGWREPGIPNIADKAGQASLAISQSVFDALGVTRHSRETGQTLGSNFEKGVAAFLDRELRSTSGSRFLVGHGRITDFAQYRHLGRLVEIVNELDVEGTLRAELGTDYLVKPDVTVGVTGSSGDRFLHAAVSCKWTIRSDRVQNIRHEGVILSRHRRGRQPHIVTVTCEPLPSRLAAIARGTGEVDCVYHASLEELHTALLEAAAQGRLRKELDVLEELIEQDRLRSLIDLPRVVAEI